MGWVRLLALSKIALSVAADVELGDKINVWTNDHQYGVPNYVRHRWTTFIFPIEFNNFAIIKSSFIVIRMAWRLRFRGVSSSVPRSLYSLSWTQYSAFFFFILMMSACKRSRSGPFQLELSPTRALYATLLLVSLVAWNDCTRIVYVCASHVCIPRIRYYARHLGICP